MEKIKRLNELISDAEAVVVGAGAGLSSAAGFEYGGNTFFENFGYMHELYGYNDMYSAGFHTFETSEEKWGFWSIFIYLNRYKYGAKPLYAKLYSVLKDKNYFVLTTNVDHQFQLAGFDKKRLFYTQGDYGLFQCSAACHDKTYDNKDVIMQMVAEQREHKIPSSLVPKCPVCGEEMEVNLRKDELFVEDRGWKIASDRYSDFISENRDKRILFLELGVGYNTPGIIKYPFMQMAYSFPQGFYACVNMENHVPKELAEKSLTIDGDLAEVIFSLK